MFGVGPRCCFLRPGGACRAVVAEAACRGRQRFVEAALRAAGGAFGMLAELAFGGGAFAALIAWCACWAVRVIRAFGIGAFHGFREAALTALERATLAFDAARAFAATPFLRSRAVAAKTGALGRIALASHRTLAARSTFRGTARACARTAERATLAVIAARGPVAETARGSVAAIRAAFKTTRCAFGAIARIATGRALATVACAFEAARGAFATFSTVFKPARCAFGAITCVAARGALTAIARAFEAARRALAALGISPTRGPFATFSAALESTRSSFATVTAALEPTRSSFATFSAALEPTRSSFATFASAFEPPWCSFAALAAALEAAWRAFALITARRVCHIRITLARKRSFGTWRTRTARRRLTATRPAAARLAPTRPAAAGRRACARPAEPARRRLRFCRTGRLARRRAAGTHGGTVRRRRTRMLRC